MSATVAEPYQRKLMDEAVAAGDDVAILILKTVFGWNRLPPAFGPSCVITPDGYMLTNLIDKNGKGHVGYSIGQVSEFVDNFRRYSDKAKLSDDETIVFFAELRKWVVADNRPREKGELLN